jgi:hypothetical protein
LKEPFKFLPKLKTEIQKLSISSPLWQSLTLQLQTKEDIDSLPSKMTVYCHQIIEEISKIVTPLNPALLSVKYHHLNKAGNSCLQLKSVISQ